MEFSKADAAQYLGVSVRALERYTQQSKIGVRYVKGRAKPSPMYDQGELDRFKSEMEAVVNRPAVQVMGAGQVMEAAQEDEMTMQLVSTDNQNTLQIAQVLAARITSQVLEQVFAAQSATNRQEDMAALADRVVLGEKLLLTLAEAQTLTGLSRGILKAAIDSGALKAQQIGRAWRIKRTDLDKWIEAL